MDPSCWREASRPWICSRSRTTVRGRHRRRRSSRLCIRRSRSCRRAQAIPTAIQRRETLERLGAVAGGTYRTDTDGAVEVTFTGHALRVKRAEPGPRRSPEHADPRATIAAGALTAAVGRPTAVRAPAFSAVCPAVGRDRSIGGQGADGARGAASPAVAFGQLAAARAGAGLPALGHLRDHPDGGVDAARLPSGRWTRIGDRPSRPRARDGSPRLLLGRRRVWPRGGGRGVPEGRQPLPGRPAGPVATRGAPASPAASSVRSASGSRRARCSARAASRSFAGWARWSGRLPARTSSRRFSPPWPRAMAWPSSRRPSRAARGRRARPWPRRSGRPGRSSPSSRRPGRRARRMDRDAGARARDQARPGAARELATRVGGFVREGDVERQHQGRIAVMELEKLALRHADGGPVTADDVRDARRRGRPGLDVGVRRRGRDAPAHGRSSSWSGSSRTSRRRSSSRSSTVGSAS